MEKHRKKLIPIICTVVLGFIVLLFWFIGKPGIPQRVQLSDGKTNVIWQFPNGDYTGDVFLGRMEGTGEFVFDTGEILKGSFSNNDFIKGTCTYSTGVYDGEFNNTNREGTGKFTWKDGSIFQGEWVADEMSEGTLTTADKLNYEGVFENNKLKNGSIYALIDGDKFSIRVSNGTISSNISINFDDGSEYFGEYTQGKISGKGTMEYPDGSKYDGNYSEGKRNGNGTYTFANGDVYTGSWENDKMDGHGTYTWDDQTYLTGTFVKGALNGTYEYTCSKGTFRTVWKKNKCTSISE